GVLLLGWSSVGVPTGGVWWVRGSPSWWAIPWCCCGSGGGELRVEPCVDLSAAEHDASADLRGSGCFADVALPAEGLLRHVEVGRGLGKREQVGGRGGGLGRHRWISWW